MSDVDPFADLPRDQHLAPDVVLLEMARAGSERALKLSTSKVLVLSVMAGAFITVGAFFSTVIAADTGNAGVQKLLEGFGFSVGFFLVILSGAVLFTEANVEFPAALLRSGSSRLLSPILRLWVVAAAGNFLGAFITGAVIHYAHDYEPAVQGLLEEIGESKLRYRETGGIEGFAQAVVSGALGNWLVGMAAFLSVMGRTIIGKYIPVFLVVTAFVASGFLHSPANMGYYSLLEPAGAGPGWGSALGWSIAPAAIGNVLGAFFLVALPFWYAGTRRELPDR